MKTQKGSARSFDYPIMFQSNLLAHPFPPLIMSSFRSTTDEMRQSSSCNLFRIDLDHDEFVRGVQSQAWLAADMSHCKTVAARYCS